VPWFNSSMVCIQGCGDVQLPCSVFRVLRLFVSPRGCKIRQKHRKGHALRKIADRNRQSLVYQDST
jgi:hypothetical protein